MRDILYAVYFYNDGDELIEMNPKNYTSEIASYTEKTLKDFTKSSFAKLNLKPIYKPSIPLERFFSHFEYVGFRLVMIVCLLGAAFKRTYLALGGAILLCFLFTITLDGFFLDTNLNKMKDTSLNFNARCSATEYVSSTFFFRETAVRELDAVIGSNDSPSLSALARNIKLQMKAQIQKKESY